MVWRRKSFLEGRSLKAGENLLQELGAGAPCSIPSLSNSGVCTCHVIFFFSKACTFTLLMKGHLWTSLRLGTSRHTG